MTKAYEHFPGRNDFLCRGRMITSRQRSILYLTFALIVCTSVIYFAFDGRYLWGISPIIPLLGGVQLIYIMLCLFRTACSDPGIIPRGTPAEIHFAEQQMLANQTQQNPSAPRIREIQINGKIVKLKYCHTCKIFKPPRATHCSVCDNCVERFDHHCPWVGNCVGRRNYRSFYMFITSLAVYCVFILGTSILHIVLRTNELSNFGLALQQSPLSVIVIVISFFSIWSVVGLSLFHSWLILREQTTNEDIKQAYSSIADNPYANNNVLSNCCNVLCSPIPPSMIDRFSVHLIDAGDGPGASHYINNMSEADAVSADSVNIPAVPRGSVFRNVFL